MITQKMLSELLSFYYLGIVASGAKVAVGVGNSGNLSRILVSAIVLASPRIFCASALEASMS